MPRKKVIIIGGGFGGINAAEALRKADMDILLIDKTNHHLFQPLLYQVATAALSPSNIAFPIREILRKQENTSVIMGFVTAIDPKQKKVILTENEAYSYDYLIIATGATHSYFGHDEWESLAPGLKNIEDAMRIREEILVAYEKAERFDNSDEAKKYLNFVIIGGGPTGVEMAGAIAEIAKKTLVKNFRKIKPEQSQIFLIEGEHYILPSYPLKLREKAEKDLNNMGVTVLTGAKVTNITDDKVFMGESNYIETKNVIWAAGNQASSLLSTLGVSLDKQGRALVEPDLSIPGHPEVFVIGDAANVNDEKLGTLPGVAPVAMQQGRYVAKLILKEIPQQKRKSFKYFDKGSMATIGKAKAVATVGKIQISGFLAWLAWCFIHIFYLISFRSKIIVLTQWMFWYLTGRRTDRIIDRPIEEIK